MTVHPSGYVLGQPTVDALAVVHPDVDGDRELAGSKALDMLTGRDEPARLRLIGSTLDRRVDAVTAAVMRHHGVDPAAAVALSQMIGHQENLAIHLEGRHLPFLESTTQYWAARLSNDVDAYWYSYGLVALFGGLPETLSGAIAPGVRLSTIVSHPALDPFELVVEGVGAFGLDSTEIRVVVPDALRDVQHH